ncbi:MAG: IS1595 family transposase [Roseiarcus sp.]
MANSAFDAPRFNDEAAAFAYVESKLWPNGPVCPHCGNADPKRIRKMQGKATRLGLYNCNECRGQFTVRQGTIFESSHLPLHLWLQIIHLMCASKKGISTNEIQRMLSCSMKTAWFLSHRIREAMATRELGPLGGEGGVVEIDETFTGRREGVEMRRGYAHKNVVLSLVERGGSVRSFHVDSTKKVDVLPVIKANVAKESHVMTDEANQYAQLGDDFAGHDAVDHGRGEYGYRDRKTGIVITTNSAEGYFSVFKRGMIGVYQHCSEAHLHRYLAEFDFRHSNRARLGIVDNARGERALQGVKGKRLTYQTINH